MPALSRASLASVVCPSAPFLAPRLLRASASTICLGAVPVPQNLHHGARDCRYGLRAYASRPNKQHSFSIRHTRAKPTPAVPVVERYEHALEAINVTDIMELYPVLLAHHLFNPSLVRRTATTIHNHYRNSPLSTRRTNEATILPFTERMVQDIRSGKLPPHTFAHVHILGLYRDMRKFEEGQKFWTWLMDQDDRYVDQGVYGAAIELLAYQGRVSLQGMEDIYSHCLKRFPGTFAEYHLSPEAILPDRTQPTTLAGLPMLLLQGILTARLLWRDWRGAYLALDAALRLFPTQVPHRFFELFQNERPMSEGYTIFLLACRSGLVLKPGHLTRLLTQLNKTMLTSTSIEDKLLILRGMTNAIYAYIGSGGTFEGPHANSLLNGFSRILVTKSNYAGDEAQMRNAIVTTAHGTMATLLQAGMAPTPQLFVALFSLAGRLKVSNLFTVTLQDVKAAHLDIGTIGRRVLLVAAGELGERDVIQSTWDELVAEAQRDSTSIPYESWMALARACRAADFKDLLFAKLEQHAHAVTSSIASAARASVMQPSAASGIAQTLMNSTEFEAQMDVLKGHINDIASLIESQQLINMKEKPLSMFLDQTRLPLGSEETLRAVYDELTTDPNQPPPERAPDASTPLSPTGIPLDELRYQNWVTIMELMRDAEVTDAEFKYRLDEALAAGKRPNVAPLVLSFRRNQQRSWDEEAKQSSSSAFFKDKNHLRAKVRSLRAPGTERSPPSVWHSIRKVGVPEGSGVDLTAKSPVSLTKRRFRFKVTADSETVDEGLVTEDRSSDTGTNNADTRVAEGQGTDSELSPAKLLTPSIKGRSRQTVARTTDGHA